MNVNEKMVMVFDNKKDCLIGWFKQIVKKEKARFLCLMFKMKRFLLFFYVFFLCTIQRKEISLIVAKARPLVLNFCTTRTVSWSFIIG